MLWSMLLSGRVSRCAHTATVPPSTTGASGPGRTASLCPSPPRLCLEPQGGSVRTGSDQLGPELGRGEREGATVQPSAPIRLSASPFPEEISLTVPSSWQAEGEGVEEQGRGVCVREREGAGGVTASLGKREI